MTLQNSRVGRDRTSSIDEPGDLGTPEQPRLLQTALDLLVNTGVTIEDLADDAHLPASYISELVGLLEAGRRPSVEL